MNHMILIERPLMLRLHECGESLNIEESDPNL